MIPLRGNAGATMIRSILFVPAVLMLSGSFAPMPAPAPALFTPYYQDGFAGGLESQVARRCGPQSTECRPGTQGNGACYQPRSQTCYDGRVCAHGQTICRKGGTGNGGCYTLSNANYCEDGIMCPDFYRVCRRGPQGAGGCYKPAEQTCGAGRITRRPLR